MSGLLEEFDDRDSKITVGKIRDGLFSVHWLFGLGMMRESGVSKKEIKLCVSHSNRFYTIVYDDENYDDFGYILTVKETLCVDPFIDKDGSDISTISSSLIVDQEGPKTKRKKLCEDSIFSKDLEAQKPCPVYVWFKMTFTFVEDSTKELLSCSASLMLQISSSEWRKEGKFPKISDEYIYPSQVTIWIDFGTSTTREKNLIKMTNGLVEKFYNQILCDVQFYFKDGQTIGAHVVILSAGSPVFSAMFQSEFLEAKTRTVTIIDIETEVFQQLLIHMYTGSAPKLAEKNMTKKLFEAADKYNIETLKAECLYTLLEQMNLDNAISLLVWAHFYSVSELLEKALKFFAENSLIICSQPEWMDLIIDYPELCLLATQHMSQLLNKVLKST